MAQQPIRNLSTSQTNSGSQAINGSQAMDAAEKRAEAAEYRVEELEQRIEVLENSPHPTATERGPSPPVPEVDDSDALNALRQEPMMDHLLNALADGQDIGHYGRLVFAMVAHHFLPESEMIEWLTRERLQPGASRGSIAPGRKPKLQSASPRANSGVAEPAGIPHPAQRR